MRSTQLLLSLLILLLLPACGSKDSGTAKSDAAQTTAVTPAKASINDASWLVGTWGDEQNGERIHEEWKYADGILIGKSVTISEGNPPFSETMRIEPREGGLVFIVSVRGEAPVTFTATRVAPGEVIFENPAHDYPQRILYQQVTADSIYARIDGSSDDDTMMAEFFYARRH